MPPVRFQMSRAAGFRMPPHSRSVMRPSAWGNPFRIVPHGDGWAIVVKDRKLPVTFRSEMEARIRAVVLFEVFLQETPSFLVNLPGA